MRRINQWLAWVSMPVLFVSVVLATSALAPTRALATAPAPGAAKGDIDLTGYTLTFEDEFNNLSVSTHSPKGSATWYYIPPYGPAGNYSASKWDVSALSVESGILSIKAFVDSNGHWHSGNLSSVDESGQGFAQLYGYFEVRARMPKSGTGSWPAFWLMSSTSVNNTASKKFSEIDVFEWYGKAYTRNAAIIQEASHNWAPGGAPAGGEQLYSPRTPIPGGAKPWEDYHIYGCQIDPVHITWYIDGVQTNQISTSAAADYMTGPYYMMIDYALGGGWPIDEVAKDSTFDINWVRVYSLPGNRPG
jgi:beta-glucanase (GH16 family)